MYDIKFIRANKANTRMKSILVFRWFLKTTVRKIKKGIGEEEWESIRIKIQG